jgi:hypothetical protein
MRLRDNEISRVRMYVNTNGYKGVLILWKETKSYYETTAFHTDWLRS